jgi:glycosyltransferase involved in cell wall biosynthesis
MKQVEQSMLAPAVVEARVIHNGVDLSVFQQADKQAARAALDLPQNLPILLFVGQGTHRNQFKDYATMENALRRFASRSDGQDVLFLCLGEEGTEKSFGKTRIRFVGYQKDLMKVAQFYQAADLYLHAARADTFPNVVLESLACGTPVVATAVGGIPEQIEDGITGFLTPPADPEAMAARIEQILADSELRQGMGAKAAEDAHKRFSLDRQVEEHLVWFADIVSKWQPPRQED